MLLDPQDSSYGTGAAIQGFGLSPQQRHLWLLGAGGRNGYCGLCRLRVEGPLDASRLESALRQIVRQHEVLRTVFRRLPGMRLPLQVIEEEPRIAFEQHELPEPTSGRPFDLERGPLLSARLTAVNPDLHILDLELPALCVDSASLEILARHLALAYGEGNAAEASMQYVDAAVALDELLEDKSGQKGRKLWRQLDLVSLRFWRLHDERMPSARPAEEFDPRQIKRAIAPTVARGLVERCAALATSPRDFLLACFMVLLWRQGERADPIVGVVSPGRAYDGLAEALGLFEKYLPVGQSLRSAMPFRDLVANVGRGVADAEAWHEYFVWDDFTGAEEDANAFLPFCFEHRPEPPVYQAVGLRFAIEACRAYTERFRLKLSCRWQGDGLLTALEYDATSFSTPDVYRLGERFAALLASAVRAPETHLEDLDTFCEIEHQRILVEWNDTAGKLSDLCLHELFEERARHVPAAVAVSDRNGDLTFAELEDRANRLARKLQRLGAGPGTLVGLLVERSIDMVVGILGILKAGSAYLPIDPSYPAERRSFMLADAEVSVLVTQDRLVADAETTGSAGEILRLAAVSAFDTEDAGPLSSGATPDSLAYVIYTSGSTGKPKGVMVSHRAIVNRLLWMQDRFPLCPEDRLLQKTPFSFDASIWEIFVPLLAGAHLLLADPEGHQDPAYLVRTTSAREVTVLQLVPSLLNAVLGQLDLESCSSLRRLFCGGEALPVGTVERFLSRLPAVALCNLYGPTEVSIDATFQPCVPGGGGDVTPIGRPLANVLVYVTDPALRPVPEGVPGELLVGGAGLAFGYLGRPAATGERFVPDGLSGRWGERLYRTGDLVRWRDGVLDFLGRIDHQVKLRGVRIELGEIEAALRELPAVSDAAVVPREAQSGDVRLVAYVTLAEKADSIEWRELLQQRLPSAMMPVSLVVLDAFPLLPNGKVDRGALPSLGEDDPDATYVAPRTPVEEILAGRFAEVLGRERTGVRDDFFSLGGHSLLATQLASRVREDFRVELPLRTFFEAPTVEALASRIDAMLRAGDSSQAPPFERARRDGVLEPSFAQERLWFLDQLSPGSPMYNLPAAVRLRGPLSRSHLRASLAQIVERHEVLRTTFTLVDARPALRIHDEVDFGFAVADLGALPPAVREAEAALLAIQEIRQPFDLSTGPLLRLLLVALDPQEHIAVLTMHHIAGDAWSSSLLIRELSALYEARLSGSSVRFPELQFQYADFAAWQRCWLCGEALDEHLAYWRLRLAGAPSALKLPLDRPRSAAPTNRGARLPVNFPDEVTAGAQMLAKAEGVTLFMVLLAVFQTLLSYYSGQEDIVVGTDVAGRDRVETEQLIGFFINQLALRTDLSGDPSLRELLMRVREVTLGAYSHQQVPFEKLVEELKPDRRLEQAPLFQVKLVLQNVPAAALRLGEVTASPFDFSTGTAQIDLNLNLEEVGGSLFGGMEYSTELFDAATVERIVSQFQELMAYAVAAPEKRLSELVAPLAEADRRRLEQRREELGRTRASNLKSTKRKALGWS